MFKEKISSVKDAAGALPRMKRASALTVAVIYAVVATEAGCVDAAVLRLIFAALASSLAASLLFMYRRPEIFAFPIIPAAVTFVLTKNAAVTAAVLLVPSLCGASIAYNMLIKSERSRTVVFSAAAAAIGAAAAFGIYLLLGGKTLTYDGALASLKGFFASFKTPAGTSFLTEDVSLGIARYIMLTLPALAMIAVSSLAFAASSLSAALADVFHFGEYVPRASRVYVPSAVSAAIYLLSYLTSAALIASTSADVVGYTAENLLIALLPAMMIHGERTLFRLAKRHDHNVLFAVLTVILLLISPSMYLMFVSFSGAVGRIYSEARPTIKRLVRRISGGGDDGDDNDDDDDDNDNDDYDGGFGG